MISVLLNLLRLVLSPKIESTLEIVTCVVQKNVYNDAIGWKAL